MRRNTRRTDPLFVFTAVKKMAPSSREAINPEVPGECFFFFSSPRGALVWKLLMHAVPRMRLCRSLSVVQHLFCRLVLFFFFNAELVFSQGACVGARARAGVGTWVRACRGVGVGVTMFSRANRVCRATNHAHTPADANVDG